MKKFLIRIRTCYYILSRKYDNWFIVNVDKDNLIKILRDENTFDADLNYHGLRPYVVSRIIKMLSNAKDEVEMICDKANFEAEAQEFKKK